MSLVATSIRANDSLLCRRVQLTGGEAVLPPLHLQRLVWCCSHDGPVLSYDYAAQMFVSKPPTPDDQSSTSPSGRLRPFCAGCDAYSGFHRRSHGDPVAYADSAAHADSITNADGYANPATGVDNSLA